MSVEATYELGYYVACMDCESQGPIAESYEESVEKWNERRLMGELTRLC